MPAFLLLYAVLLLICYFYRPADRRALALWMPWLGLAVYGGLFLFVEWHPQWLLLLVPFVLLTTACAAGEGRVLQVVDVILACGFLLHPVALGRALGDGELLGHVVEQMGETA